MCINQTVRIIVGILGLMCTVKVHAEAGSCAQNHSKAKTRCDIHRIPRLNESEFYNMSGSFTGRVLVVRQYREQAQVVYADCDLAAQECFKSCGQSSIDGMKAADCGSANGPIFEARSHLRRLTDNLLSLENGLENQAKMVSIGQAPGGAKPIPGFSRKLGPASVGAIEVYGNNPFDDNEIGKMENLQERKTVIGVSVPFTTGP